MPAGTSYTVTILRQPQAPLQICSVADGSGTIGAAMTSVSITCGSVSEELIVSDNEGNSRGFLVDPATGALSLSSSSFTLGGQAVADSTGKFLFVSDYSAETVSVYSASASGALSPVAGNPFPIGAYPYGLVVDPTGRFLYIGTPAGAFAYRIDAASGALSLIPGSPVKSPPTGLYPGQVVCENVCLASRSVLYFPQFGGAGTFGMTGMAIDETSGALTLIGYLGVSWSPVDGSQAVIDPSGTSMYIGNGSLIGTFAINAATGALTYVATTVPPADIENSIALDPSGAFAYAVDGNRGQLLMFSRDPISGLLTPLSPSSIAAVIGAGQIQFDLQGKFVYVANAGAAFEFGSNSISTYAFSSSTGLLTSIPGSPFASPIAARSIAVMRIP